MKTYKQKAEEYVRMQLPELMELSFGCEVDTGVPRVVWEVHGTRIQTYAGGIVFSNDWDDIALRTKIIGHSIQLSDWLRVLETHSDDHMVIGNYGKDKGFFVSFGDDFEEGDVWHHVNFNLTTGQPATEEDYKAFCEIVGV